jgi:protein-histidine N-methyltransferase
MSFSFGFSGDDIEEDPNDVVEHQQQEQGHNTSENGPPPLPAKTHDLSEMVNTHFPLAHSHFSIQNNSNPHSIT